MFHWSVIGVQGRSQPGLGDDVVSFFFFFLKGSPGMFGDSAGGRFPALKPCLGGASRQGGCRASARCWPCLAVGKPPGAGFCAQQISFLVCLLFPSGCPGPLGFLSDPLKL